ncbi:hypothetical protein [Nitrosomonas sp.]|uniref:hypothetical protein n=1 Tax=Nitrosomonas sp. TaxID=42353 RepID=UPI00284F7E7C|nr:hypothetical protein [Nitrosomonas sp.]MDR4514536.1 hypothetical protein [Nitrosomonas sp.]
MLQFSKLLKNSFKAADKTTQKATLVTKLPKAVPVQLEADLKSEPHNVSCKKPD